MTESVADRPCPVKDRVRLAGSQPITPLAFVEVHPRYVDWWCDATNGPVSHVPRPVSYDFGFQSVFTTHRVDVYGSTVAGSLTPSSLIGGRILMPDMVYYYSLSALVPCPASEADGSPPVHSKTFEMFSSLKIEAFYSKNRRPHGLKVRYNCSDYIAAVKARRTLSDEWTEVARFTGTSELTTWIADQPLAAYGNFFCVALVYVPSLYSSATPEQATLPFKLTRLQDGRVRVMFDTEAGTAYCVTCCALPRGPSKELRV
ncbi:MAG TPA: hypothetical protein PLU38_09245, partial [Kiritimatiellia bacterium]|nr:hypothetical protein [Kiritimatiellia bacterium]